jgi:hypothetical protein
MNKFKNKDGSLTVYAFACGYIQEKDGVKLYKDGCWHVRGEVENGWQSFCKLSEARRAFSKMRKQVLATK